MKKIFLRCILLLVSCQTHFQIECTQDGECSKAGCSSQFCLGKADAEKTVTMCEFKEGYVCYQQAQCGCVQGKCSWKDQERVDRCLRNVSDTEIFQKVK